MSSNLGTPLLKKVYISVYIYIHVYWLELRIHTHTHTHIYKYIKLSFLFKPSEIFLLGDTDIPFILGGFTARKASGNLKVSDFI